MTSRPVARRLAGLSLAAAALAVCLVSGPGVGTALAAEPTSARAIYEKASPAFVAVQYVWENEMRRQEVTAAGIAVGPDIVAIPGYAIPEQLIPDAQIKDFKVILPKVDADHEELEATFVGRDERYQLAFIKIKDPEKKLPATLAFTDHPLAVGDTVYSIAMMPKGAGYRTYLAVGNVSTFNRGEVPTIQVTGQLAGSGGAVFNTAGEAVGFVMPHEGAFFWLEPRPRQVGPDNPQFFVPASEIVPALTGRPADGKWAPLSFTGIMALSGLNKDLAEVFDLKGKPAVEIGDVVPGSPAAKAGLEKGMIITEVDGKPLERGDEPDELGPIMSRTLQRTKKPGDTVSLTVIAKKGEAPKKVDVTLIERPVMPNAAARFYAEDLGYTVREAVFMDRYQRKLDDTAKGVVVDFVKPQSSAQTGRLQRGDMVTQMNGQPVTDVATFKTAYEAFRKDKPKDPLVLQVLREGNTQILRIEPPQ